MKIIMRRIFAIFHSENSENDSAFREALIQSARADSEGFDLGKRNGKGRNTLCISPFPFRISYGKDPLRKPQTIDSELPWLFAFAFPAASQTGNSRTMELLQKKEL